ncbi:MULTISPECIES: hypothetical protein [unclassified Bacillus (in: firmicutes)]|uniref:hypothetical protein n=1 Tax=unclassified Bacillus (in: firmicutes) TaxID=185979 RepID=UPI000BEF6CED|nr:MULTISPECIES: hypothetical protein [unclassified Bacillus (in: firmicutes)]PEJ52355.1 hypothetical protein CN692_21825 [Bacillus sp. AFS002410]PEL14270.1 hypothetical protein CN601_01615 [Bacillus sp. AFS017336]
MNFLKAYFSSFFIYLILIIGISIPNLIDSDGVFNNAEFVGSTGSYAIFGLIFVLGGCAIGEGLFLIFNKSAKYYYFVLLGLLYGVLILKKLFHEPLYGSYDYNLFSFEILSITTIGSMVFFLVRSKQFD